MLTLASHYHPTELLFTAAQGPHLAEGCSTTEESFKEIILPAPRRQKKKRARTILTSTIRAHPTNNLIFLSSFHFPVSQNTLQRTNTSIGFGIISFQLYSIISGVRQANPGNLASNMSVQHRLSYFHPSFA
jgi:hypothetical protein